jgi:hypothetical protein
VYANGNYLYAPQDDKGKDSAYIKSDWFSVEKRGKQKLVVKVSENKSKNSRKIRITLESGNYFDYVNVSQKGKEQ